MPCCRWAPLGAALVLLALVGCSNDSPAPPPSAETPTTTLLIQGAGASFPNPLYQAWIERYREIESGTRIEYRSVGSGAGVASFLAESVDFGASDAALNDVELARVGARGVVMVPVTAGMVVLAYNLPGVPAGLKLPRDVQIDLFRGRVTRWNDPRIQEANPGISLPPVGIMPIVRRDGSGTTFVFTHYLSAISDWWRSEGPGAVKALQWPVATMTAPGNEGVSARIKVTHGGIGYVEYAFARQLGLSVAALENRAGAFVMPATGAGTAALASIPEIPDDLRIFVADPPGADAYPLTSYTWLLLHEDYPQTPEVAAGLRRFVAWALTDGQALAAEMGYVPLPDTLVQRAQAALERLR